MNKRMMGGVALLVILWAGGAGAEDLCKKYVANGQFDGNTIAACTKEIKSGSYAGSDLALLYAGRGWAYKEAKKYDPAIADLSKAISLNPSLAKTLNAALAEVYILRGGAFAAAKKYDSEIADYSKAIGLDPLWAKAYCHRSEAFLKKGMREKSRADHDKALALEWVCKAGAPDADDLCSAQAIDAQYDKAIQQCTADINSGSFSGADLAVKYVNRGWSYLAGFESNKISVSYDLALDNALADLSKAIELNPSDSQAYTRRGWVHEKKDRYKGPESEHELAIGDFNRAIRLDPANSMAYKRRGWTYIDKTYTRSSSGANTYYDLAIADFTSAIEIDPADSDAYDARGTIYKDKGQYDLALRDLNKAIELNPSNGSAFCTRGDVYKELGNADKTGADHKKARQLGDDLCY